MTVSFFSNFLLLHQTPFCEAMVRLIGDGFRFVATERIPADRLAMGYEDMSHSAPYALNSYESPEAHAEAMRLGLESDVVIIGSAPDEFIRERLRRNKLTFRYSERFFKQGLWRLLDPRVFYHRFVHDFRHRRKQLYMLCASAYTASDCRHILSYPGKTFKWGYFPEVKTYDERQLMEGKQSARPAILWVGRLIPLKHPENTVRLARALASEGLDFEMTIIGEGPMRPVLEDMAARYGLGDRITFKDFMPQAEVRRNMERANIFFFTSDRQEGWGAVLNEAMNSGCAVVANDEIGSVPFLISDGENGLTYHKDARQLIRQVARLIKDPGLTERLGLAAYRTMQTRWNASAASARLLTLFKQILNHDKPDMNLFESGPVSRC